MIRDFDTLDCDRRLWGNIRKDSQMHQVYPNYGRLFISRQYFLIEASVWDDHGKIMYYNDSLYRQAYGKLKGIGWGCN